MEETASSGDEMTRHRPKRSLRSSGLNRKMVQEEKEVVPVQFFPLIGSFLVTAASPTPRTGTLEIEPVPTEGEDKLQNRRRVVACEAFGKESASDSCIALWPAPAPPTRLSITSSPAVWWPRPPHTPA